MMNKENLLTKYLEKINNKEPITINYGKSEYSDQYIKDYAIYDYQENCYRDETGMWNTELLIEIAKNEVPGITLEG